MDKEVKIKELEKTYQYKSSQKISISEALKKIDAEFGDVLKKLSE